MKRSYFIAKQEWDKILISLTGDCILYAPTENQGVQDYQTVTAESVDQIVYNTPKPTTPLKTFFIPVRENVVREPVRDLRRIILGIPSCDLAALDLLDAIFLEEPYVDPYYRRRRENTVLIGTDCHSLLEHCHCTTYGMKPYPFRNHDIALSVVDENVFISINSEKGGRWIEKISSNGTLRECSEEDMRDVNQKREEMVTRLNEANRGLPDAEISGGLVKSSEKDIWEKYAATCVSCGACATICPTCTCFLLIDRPEFEKVRQLDACQFPAFERVAAGEDPLGKSYVRFRNRYMCKYVWKPAQFNIAACTGCGRCIEACIGGINKNELFTEMYQLVV
jgi:ferredoxin